VAILSSKVIPNEKGANYMTWKTMRLVISITVAVAALCIVAVKARTNSNDAFDAAAEYKKCVACHGAKAEKKFDPAKSDDEHIQVILKGKKMAKPPHMPGYAEKGMTAEQAKELLDHMKSLRQ
jgi:mono/diheme cytochrome c family protein